MAVVEGRAGVEGVLVLARFRSTLGLLVADRGGGGAFLNTPGPLVSDGDREVPLVSEALSLLLPKMLLSKPALPLLLYMECAA